MWEVYPCATRGPQTSSRRAADLRHNGDSPASRMLRFESPERAGPVEAKRCGNRGADGQRWVVLEKEPRVLLDTSGEAVYFEGSKANR